MSGVIAYKDNYALGYRNGHYDRQLIIRLSTGERADNLPGYSDGYRHGVLGLKCQYGGYINAGTTPD